MYLQRAFKDRESEKGVQGDGIKLSVLTLIVIRSAKELMRNVGLTLPAYIKSAD
jgi:hypothetical protein